LNRNDNFASEHDGGGGRQGKLQKTTGTWNEKNMQHKRGTQRLHSRFVEGTSEHAADEGGAEEDVWHGENMRR
jgi:hypothetical protein